LQDRGFNSPQFFDDPNNALLVVLGTRSSIQSISFEGVPEGLVNLRKRRNLMGEILTPKKLDEISQWIRGELQNHGYGCPQITLSADIEGHVKISVIPGPVHLVSEIKRSSAKSYDVKILDRYSAFQKGEKLDNRLLTLSADRALQDDLFLSAYFDLRCDSFQSLGIFENVVVAKPRLITIGVGIDTEGLVKGRIQWKHSKIGKKANTLQAQLEASFIEQKGELLGEWFPASSASRFHFVPQIKGARFSEDQYEAISAEASIPVSSDYDFLSFNLQGSYGPAYEYADTRKGEGPQNSRFLSFKGQLKAVSHAYEYFLSNPESGWEIEINTYSRFKKIYASSTFHRVSIDTTALWNLGNYKPAYAVFGWRASVGSFWLPQGNFENSVPLPLRFFLGGDSNIRGFSRKEIPNDGLGFKSYLYNGFELRAGDVIPFGIQPFLFFDIGWGGGNGFRLQKMAYTSPGGGIRWGSKIGVFRGTAAHGFFWGEQPKNLSAHWQFFLSYGQEF